VGTGSTLKRVSSRIKLEVFDILGRKVTTLVNGQFSGGTHQVTFDASNLASGMYLYRIQTDNFVQTRKLTLLKIKKTTFEPGETCKRAP